MLITQHISALSVVVVVVKLCYSYIHQTLEGINGVFVMLSLSEKDK